MTQRGSVALSTRALSISDDDLNKLVKLIQREGVSVVGWHTHGIPAIDELHGTLHVSPERVGTLLGELAGVDHPRLRFNVLTHGIPAIDLVAVDFHAGRTQ
jgi:hypothetical protein